MRRFVNTENRWDVLTLVQVMRGLLPQIFSSAFPDDFHAKEFLTTILRVVGAHIGRAHQQSHFNESNALTAMSQMILVLQLCKSDIAANNVTTMLEEAKQLVDTARNTTQTYTAVSLDAQEYNAQLAYLSLNNFGTHVKSEVGKHGFQDGVIAFGKNLLSKWHSVIKSQKVNFKTIALLHNWYFHHIDGDSNISDALTAMEEVVAAIAGVQTSATVSPWQTISITTDTTTPITIILNPLLNRMSIPVARERILVGRTTSIDRVTTQLLAGPCTRVLIHGDPGVGKDTVAAEVVHTTDSVQQLGGLQAWLQASSELVFRRQLIDVFTTHRPWVVRGFETDASKSVKKIFTFLRNSREEWLFVFEDMSSESTTAFDLLSETIGIGHVLITSQSLLSGSDSSLSAIKLEPFTTDDSLDLLRRMNLFSTKVSIAANVDAETIEAMLRTHVEAAVSTLSPERRNHCTRLRYTTPPVKEKSSAKKQRQR